MASPAFWSLCATLFGRATVVRVCWALFLLNHQESISLQSLIAVFITLKIRVADFIGLAFLINMFIAKCWAQGFSHLCSVSVALILQALLPRGVLLKWNRGRSCARECRHDLNNGWTSNERPFLRLQLSAPALPIRLFECCLIAALYWWIASK